MASLPLRQGKLETGPRGGAERDLLASSLLILALAIGALRFWRLGEWSLWGDEAFSLADALHRDRLSNPLGYRLLGWFYGLWPNRPGELLLRLPAAIFGWLSIPAAYLVFRRPWGERTGAFTALVLASSSWHLYWSQNTRFYTLALLLGLVGGGLVLRGLRQSYLAVISGFVLVALAALTHPTGALLFGGLAVSPWLVRRGASVLPVESGLEVGRGALRALLVMSILGASAGAGWATDVWSTWAERTGEGTPKHFALSSGFLIGPTLGLGLAFGLFVAWRRRQGRDWVLAATCVAGLVVALAASFLVRASAQYIFILLPWMAAVAGLPLEAGLRGRPRHSLLGVVYAAFVVIPMWLDSGLYFTVRNGDRPHWREAYQWVYNHLEEGDHVLGMEAPVGEYYVDPFADDLRNWSRVTWLDSYRASQPFRWARYDRRTWLVVNLEQLKDWAAADRERMHAFLAEECRVGARFEVPLTPRDLDVVVYLRE